MLSWFGAGHPSTPAESHVQELLNQKPVSNYENLYWNISRYWNVKKHDSVTSWREIILLQ